MIPALPTSQSYYEDKMRLNCLEVHCECYMNRKGEGMGLEGGQTGGMMGRPEDKGGLEWLMQTKGQ